MYFFVRSILPQRIKFLSHEKSVSVWQARIFQNCWVSYFWPNKLHKKVCEITQNGQKYDAQQSWHTQNSPLTNNYHFIERPTFSTIQCLKMLISNFLKSWPPSLLKSACANIWLDHFQSWVIEWVLNNQNLLLTITDHPWHQIYQGKLNRNRCTAQQY